jgi:hypothetical protein
VTPDVAIVELAAPAASPEHAKAMVDACATASASARCALAPAEEARIIASISLSDGDLAARIEVRLARGDGEAVVRSLRFSREDAVLERYKAIGLVVGTLAEGMVAEATAPVADERPEENEPEKRERHAPEEKREKGPAPPPPAPPVVVDAVALVGSALDDGSARAGLALRGAYVFDGLPLLLGTSFRYAVRPADEAGLEVHWIGGTVGIGTALPLGVREVVFDARLELVAELLLATVSEPFTGASDATSRWVGGGRLSAHIAYMPTRSFGVVGGIDGTLVQSGTVVKIREERSGRVPPYSLAGSLGVRFAFP